MSPISPKNLFMSHSWNQDTKERPTHERVKLLKQELDKLGWKVWIDEEQLLVGCNIDVSLANGIKQSDVICTCLTRSYIEKVNSQNNNCSKEWNFAQIIGKKILPLIMEEELLDVKAWPQGLMTMYLGNTFHIDCSGDNIPSIALKLSKMLELLGLSKRKRERNYSWRIVKGRVYPYACYSSSTKNIRQFIRI